MCDLCACACLAGALAGRAARERVAVVDGGVVSVRLDMVCASCGVGCDGSRFVRAAVCRCVL